LSIKDFRDYCKKHDIKVLEAFYVAGNKKQWFLPNLLATVGIFLIQK